MTLEVTFSTNDPAKLGQIITAATEIGLTLVRVKGRETTRAPAPTDDVANEEEAEHEEGADTLLFPAKPPVGTDWLLQNSAWRSIRLSERTQAKIKDGTIKHVAAYEAAPGAQAVRWIADIKGPPVESEIKPGKWRINLENLQEIDPIPYGGVNVRSTRFVSMAKLRNARTLADI